MSRSMGLMCTEFNALCDELVQEIGFLVNPDTGKKAVSEVLTLDELCREENIWDLPDLLVTWVKDGPIKGLYSPSLGTITGENQDKRTGAHKSEGILITSGVQISPVKNIKGGHIVDIAPTILCPMGQPVPRDLDGKVILDIFEDEFKVNNPVSYLC